LLNSTNVALIAKKDGAQKIGECRLISIKYSMAKLLGKILANRLAPILTTSSHTARVCSSMGEAFMTISNMFKEWSNISTAQRPDALRQAGHRQSIR
jgi:hypothetical protein